jgi:hypothetical protein
LPAKDKKNKNKTSPCQKYMDKPMVFLLKEADTERRSLHNLEVVN